jgi:hypothetical protein
MQSICLSGNQCTVRTLLPVVPDKLDIRLHLHRPRLDPPKDRESRLEIHHRYPFCFQVSLSQGEELQGSLDYRLRCYVRPTGVTIDTGYSSLPVCFLSPRYTITVR